MSTEAAFPEKFELSLDTSVAKAMTDAQLDELGKQTNARVLVDILKEAAKTPIETMSSHSKMSWSYTSNEK